jgi:hypothetical protein
MHRSLVSLGILLLPAMASASAPDLTTAFAPRPTFALMQDDAPAESDSGGLSTISNDNDRNYDMEVSFRGRYLSVPGSILDIWYFNETDDGWAIPNEKRPKVRGYGLGVEFVVKSKPRDAGIGGANGIFYFDWLASTLQTGYWDDVEEPPDHLDGDYIDPDGNLGLAVIGADYAYEIHMVKTSQTDGNFGMSMLVGGGLGVAIKVGDLKRWGPADGKAGFERYHNNEEPDGDKRVPGVLPMVDITLGLRFNFADRAVLRIEGGVHDLLFMGGSLGIMF